MLTFEEKERIFFDAVINFEGQFDADFLMKLLFGRVSPEYVINDEILRSSKLHAAVISKNCSLALVQSILAEDSSLLNQKNIFQVSPLHRAVYCAKNLDVVIELLKHGAYVNAVERSMMSSLHIVALKSSRYQYDLLRILIEYGGNVNCVDYKDQTPLHMLVKNRIVQEQSLCLLLRNGADPNACDKDNNSILKVAIQNQYISLNVIKILLKFGANPENDLKYCLEKFPHAKLLIQFIAIDKIENVFPNIDGDSLQFLLDQFIDLTYFDFDTYMELSTFRNNCVNELIAMRKVRINQNYTLFKFIKEHCSNTLKDTERHTSLLEDVLLSLKQGIFSHCSDLIDAAFDLQDILNILSEQGIYAKPLENSSESKRVYLNYYTIIDLASYVTKKDLINLTLAYINKNKHKNCAKRKICLSKSIKRIHEGLSDSTMCMKRLKL